MSFKNLRFFSSIEFLWASKTFSNLGQMSILIELKYSCKTDEC